jgi:hypothetical protein
MKLIVCGGKRRGMAYSVDAYLTALHGLVPITLILEGGDLGAGRHARAWAIRHKIPYITQEGDYDQHGADAWGVRNAAMLRQADAVLAFPGIGADNMVEQAKGAGVMVYEPFA